MLKAQNMEMSADLRLAEEREKAVLEEMKSKDEKIVELKQFVEYWKKKAESRLHLWSRSSSRKW